MDDAFPDDLLPCIEKFFETDHLRQPGKDLYPAVFDADVFYPLQRPRELATMMKIARSINPKVVMEIGADKGGGLYHWCKCLPTVTDVFACEIRGLPYASAFEKAFQNIQFLWLPKSSYDPATVDCVSKWLREITVQSFIDVLFLDGDKSYYGRDFELYTTMMNPNGIVFWHDIQDCPNIRRDYDKACNGRRHIEVIDTTEALESLIRKNAGIPSANQHEDWLRYWGGRSCGVGVIWLGGNV